MGGVEIQHSSVSCLAFSDRMFDLVTAVNTHYWWPDLVADRHEVLRIQKLGGKLIIIAEAYKGRKYKKVSQKLVGLLKTMNDAHLSVTEPRELFSRAGYTAV
ncbi:MAG TPA: methyltransferase domain-containing protein [Ktedonobacteraceae bacterium]|nr:methyltransferase domain-containing protein [Ktedonobacteraceae bacterium]